MGRQVVQGHLSAPAPRGCKQEATPLPMCFSQDVTQELPFPPAGLRNGGGWWCSCQPVPGAFVLKAGGKSQEADSDHTAGLAVRPTSNKVTHVPHAHVCTHTQLSSCPEHFWLSVVASRGQRSRPGTLPHKANSPTSGFASRVAEAHVLIRSWPQSPGKGLRLCGGLGCLLILGQEIPPHPRLLSYRRQCQEMELPGFGQSPGHPLARQREAGS